MSGPLGGSISVLLLNPHLMCAAALNNIFKLSIKRSSVDIWSAAIRENEMTGELKCVNGNVTCNKH